MYKQLYLSIGYTLLPLAAVAEEYKRWSDVMDLYNFTWEAKEVTTDDGYILTTFHLTGNEDGLFTPTKGSVLIQHGGAEDAAVWVDYYRYMNDRVPMPLQLAEDGYDVWFGNNRGSEYSQRHTSLTVDQPEFWAWSWAEMGIYDDVANIKAIKEHSGAEKVFYLGMSQGTIQFFYALAKLDEEFFANNVHAFVALAPCTMYNTGGAPESYFAEPLMRFPEIGVHALYGPNWASDRVKICDQVGQELCDAMFGCEGCQGTSVQSEAHWAQNAYVNRFQEYAPRYLEGERETALIDKSSIGKIPIAMFVGKDDQVCLHSQAEEDAKAIGDAVVLFESVEGADHAYFGHANDESFMNLLKSQLQDPQQKNSDQDGSSVNFVATLTSLAIGLSALAF